ncbi:hypothetical protein Poli38472_009360 [Pythium oligandrum]|uniref:Calmodulin n=1 Tax=Pythium oligandrum TaxID=41045 RepID=A0A8K1CLK8_PYTOL|nr:hypothetical protein Poli38472_009360 [Pythium oligandrum]|eukprot:TMW65193.1 hypothetical protein Poli38472_009360 [Pythium oligandrum]
MLISMSASSGGVRRRRLLVQSLGLGLILFWTHGQATETGPGTVSAPGTWDQAIPEHTLTTSCGAACADATGASVCLGLADTKKNCQGANKMAGVTCASSSDSSASSVLCMSPDKSQWRFQLTKDPELLAIGRQGVVLTEDLGVAMTLDAGSAQTVGDFKLAPETNQLYLSAANPAEQLTVTVSTATIAQWSNLEVLSLRNLDLSTVSGLPTFPKLLTLDVSGARLAQWPILESAPALASLDLSFNGLTTIPAGSIPAPLTTLNASSNSLTQLPDDLASLSALRKLSLSHNDMSQVAEFPELPALKSLYLSSTNLGVLPSGIETLPQLDTLDVSDNALGDLPEDVLPPTLTTLIARNTGLTKLPAIFDVDKTWERIDLSRNALNDEVLAPAQFRAVNLTLDDNDLTALPPNTKIWAIGTALSLSNNAFGTVDAKDLPASISDLRLASCSLSAVPSNLQSLPRLEYLELSSNPLGTVPAGTLPKTLTDLLLATCELSAVPEDVSALSATLKTLDLSTNKISDVSALRLKDFTSLRRLELQNNHLSSIPDDVFSIKQLSHLDLSGNPITNVTLSQVDFHFLATQVRYFAIDPAAFESATCANRWQLRGKYSVCVDGSGSYDPSMENREMADAPQRDPLASPTQASVSDEKDSKSSFAPLNIVVIAAIVMVFGVSLFVHSNRRKKQALGTATKNAGDDDYDALATMRRFAPVDMWEDAELLYWRVDAQDLELTMQVGTSASSVFWLGRYQTETVAVKRLSQKKPDRDTFRLFVDEIKAMSKLEHPRIVQFLGVTWTSGSDLSMMMEFMNHGDLQKYLQSTKGDVDAKHWTSRKFSIAMSIADALVYLHSLDPYVIHRDLKSSNVLLDENYNAKVAGFGSSRLRADNMSTSTRWIAPEVLSGSDKFSEASDVYSFGVILSEMDSHELPFSDITLSNGKPLADNAMKELLIAGALQPTLSKNCPKEIVDLIGDCMAMDPNRRPSALQALERIRRAVEATTAIARFTSSVVRVSRPRSDHSDASSNDLNKSYYIRDGRHGRRLGSRHFLSPSQRRRGAKQSAPLHTQELVSVVPHDVALEVTHADDLLLPETQDLHESVEPSDWASEEGARRDLTSAVRRATLIDLTRRESLLPRLAPEPQVSTESSTVSGGHRSPVHSPADAHVPTQKAYKQQGRKETLHGKDLRQFVSIGSIDQIPRHSNSVDWSETSADSDEPDHLSLMDPYYDLTKVKLTRLFSLFQPDASGMVGYEGFRRGLEAMGIVCADDDDFRAFINKVDEDQSGGISYEEFQQAVQEIKLAQLFNNDFLHEMSLDTLHIKRQPVILGSIEYSPDRIRTVYPIGNLEKFIYSRKPTWATVRWINVEGNDPLMIRRLSVRYRLHPLAVEDALEVDRERPKYEKYDEHSLLILQTVHPVDMSKLRQYQKMYRNSLYTRDEGPSQVELMDRKELEERLEGLKAGDLMTNPDQLSIYMLKDVLISVQERSGPLWNAVKTRLDTSYSKIRQHGTRFLVYSIVDVCVDDLTPIVHTLGAKLLMLERLLMLDPMRFELVRLQNSAKQLKGLKRLCKPLKEVIEQMSESNDFSGETLRYFRDVQDHLVIIEEDCEKHLDTCRSLVDAFHNLRAARQSDVSYVLTLVAAVFLPAQFLTGLYGMNFEVMPELKYEYGYYIWWAVVLSIAVATVSYFHFYKRWL